MPSTTSVPAASRAAMHHRAVSAIDSRGSNTPLSAWPLPMKRMAFQPCSMSSSVWSTIAWLSAGERVVAKVGITSRCLPPSSSYTGTPSALPLMSCSAMSMAEIAACSTRPPSKYWLRYISCQMRPICIASCPMRNSR
jgi:hypothetical protein